MFNIFLFLCLGDDYIAEILPVGAHGEPCMIYINASILAFPFIDTINLKFTADFYLNLRWYDLRMDLMDLNNITFLNALNLQDINSIWAPTLKFLNALGPFSTIMDKSSTGVLIRQGTPLKEDMSLSTEGRNGNTGCED